MRFPNLITKDGNLYEILETIPRSNFINKDGSLNGKVIGMYVKEVNADRVLEKEGKLLICQLIEDANLI